MQTVLGRRDPITSQIDEFFQGLVIGYCLLLIYFFYSFYQSIKDVNRKPITLKQNLSHTSSGQIVQNAKIVNQQTQKVQVVNQNNLNNLQVQQRVNKQPAQASIALQLELKEIQENQDQNLFSDLENKNKTKANPNDISQDTAATATPERSEKELKLAKRQEIKEEVIKVLFEEYEKREQYEKMYEDKKKRVLMRKIPFSLRDKNIPDGIMMEMDMAEILPQDLFNVFNNMETEQIHWNKHCKRCIVFDKDEDILLTDIKLPYPLQPRLFIDGRYTQRMNNNEEFVIIFSSIGNEELAKRYLVENNITKTVVSKSYISGYWFRPWFEEDTTQVIGTKIYYLNSCDVGSNIPQWAMSKILPAGIMETFESVRKYSLKVNNKK